ncbi:MAG: hypothetical protein E7576_16380 [Ruminococcaceae bacterium]|nr:hypothetical protein [Oscillospiraceae bacterium]
MKRTAFGHKCLFHSFSVMLLFLFCAHLLVLPAAAYLHNAKPDAGVPTDLIASYDYDAAKAAAGQSVWALESMRIYKLYQIDDDGTEYAEWDISNVNFDENGGSLTVSWLLTDSVFTSRFILPGKTVASPEDFQIITFNGQYESEWGFWGAGTISIAPSTETNEMLNSGDGYLDTVTYGTETVIDGASARVHNLARTVPAAESGTVFRVSVFSGFYAIDLFYTVPDPSAPIVQNVTTEAEATPGEDEGVEIISEIIEGIKPKEADSVSAETVALSVGGALAAAGILSAAAGSKKDGNREEQKKRYKMYVYKAFGDVIQKGAQPMTVYARVSQIIDGKEYDCPEQTEKIGVSGENLTVRPAGIRGQYMAADVTADAASEAQNGTVVFTLTGPGGVIRRSVVFRLVNEPQIAFPGDPAGGVWDMSVVWDTVEMVAGEGGRERLRFVILDAPEEPKVIRFRDTEGFDIDYEPDPKLGFTYYAVIDNRTDRAEKGGDIFAEMEERHIIVEAIFKDGTQIQNSFTIELYPDGLSVVPNRDIVKNDRLIVDTEENPSAKEGYAKIPPVIFDFTVCYVDDRTDKAVILKNPSFDHGDPTDDGKYGHLFSDNFEYRISHMGKAGVAFFPLNTLPFLGDVYEAKMPISHDTERQRFEGEIPMAVSGEKPSLPSSAEWQKAYAWLRRDIQYFGIENDPALKIFLAHIEEHSASEIEHVRLEIIKAGVDFYEKYGEAHGQYGDLMEKYVVVAGCLVKAGDYALEYVLKQYFVGYGSIAAKFINPMKNLLATYVGEYVASGNLDAAPDFLETVLKSSEDALAAAITGMFWGSDLDGNLNTAITFGNKSMNITAPPVTEQIKDVLGYIIAVYLLTSFARHYNYGKSGEKGDIYRSAVAACADLGLESLKAWFLDYVSRYCSSLFERIGKACGELYKKACQKKIAEAAEKAGWNAFGDSIRGSLKTDLRGLTKESLNAARDARSAAEQGLKESRNEMLDNITKYLGQSGAQADKWIGKLREDTGDLGNVGAGQGLNYLMGGSREDSSESRGTDVKEVVYNSVTDWFGVKVGKVYEDGGALNPYDVTVRIENGKIILGVLGCRAEIGILENIAALCDLLYDSLFSWLNVLWQGITGSLDFRSVPDLRDRMEKNVEIIDRELEAQKERLENLEWQFTEYR